MSVRQRLLKVERSWLDSHTVFFGIAGIGLTIGTVILGVTWWVGYPIWSALYVAVALTLIVVLVEIAVAIWVELDERRKERDRDEARLKAEYDHAEIEAAAIAEAEAREEALFPLPDGAYRNYPWD